MFEGNGKVSAVNVAAGASGLYSHRDREGVDPSADQIVQTRGSV